VSAISDFRKALIRANKLPAGLNPSIEGGVKLLQLNRIQRMVALAGCLQAANVKKTGRDVKHAAGGAAKIDGLTPQVRTICIILPATRPLVGLIFRHALIQFIHNLTLFFLFSLTTFEQSITLFGKVMHELAKHGRFANLGVFMFGACLRYVDAGWISWPSVSLVRVFFIFYLQPCYASRKVSTCLLFNPCTSPYLYFFLLPFRSDTSNS
jgi:hypothetical protein